MTQYVEQLDFGFLHGKSLRAVLMAVIFPAMAAPATT